MSWERLAAAVVARRNARGWTQVEVATRGGLSLDRLQAIEGVRAAGYRPRTMQALERGLDWLPGSVACVLAGGQPEEIPECSGGSGPVGAHRAIARNLRALRAARGWSVRQLAEECAKRGAPQLTQASLVNIERDTSSGRGQRRVTVEELVFLADLFGVTPADLFDAPTWAPCGACGGTGRISVDRPSFAGRWSRSVARGVLP